MPTSTICATCPLSLNASLTYTCLVSVLNHRQCIESSSFHLTSPKIWLPFCEVCWLLSRIIETPGICQPRLIRFEADSESRRAVKVAWLHPGLTHPHQQLQAADMHFWPFYMHKHKHASQTTSTNCFHTAHYSRLC